VAPKDPTFPIDALSDVVRGRTGHNATMRNVAPMLQSEAEHVWKTFKQSVNYFKSQL
jgi:hypothetical protein